MRIVFALSVLAISAIATAQNALVPKSLASFDGKSWSGLSFGIDTDSSLKKNWKAGKGAIRPEALRLESNNPDVHVDAILGGRGAKALLECIRIEFIRAPMSIEAIAKEVNEEPVRYWQTERNEDWYAVAFPRRGLLAYVMNGRPGEDEYAAVVTLAPPNRIYSSVAGYATEPTRIVPVFDPGRNWNRTTLFSDIRVRVSPSSTNRPATLTDINVRRIERRTEDDMRRAYARGAMAYDRNGRGRYEISVTSGKFNEKFEASFSGNAKYTADTPYGPIEVTEYESKTIKSDHARELERLLANLMDDLERKVEDAVRRLGPPPIDARRKAGWAETLDVLSGRK